MLPALLGEPFRRANRPTEIQDESIDSFFSRRFGPQFARMFGSALLHGIFAADSRKLSVRSIFPSMWDAEEVGHGRLSVGLLKRSFSQAPQDDTYELGTLGHDMRDVSVYTFDGGLEIVTEALREELRTRPNVEVRTGVDLKALRPTPDGAFQVSPFNLIAWLTHSKPESLRRSLVNFGYRSVGRCPRSNRLCTSYAISSGHHFTPSLPAIPDLESLVDGSSHQFHISTI
jgi:hypothetical protein